MKSYTLDSADFIESTQQIPHCFLIKTVPGNWVVLEKDIEAGVDVVLLAAHAVEG